MKLFGKKIQGPNIEYIVIPRQDDLGNPTNIILQAQAVLNMEEFETMCPQPKPPLAQYPSGEQKIVFEDPAYVEKINTWAVRKSQYIILKSLEGTPGLEWETVKINDPETWDNYTKELNSAGFTEHEVNYIINKVMEANSMSNERLQEARESFLLSRRTQQVQSLSQKVEHTISPSGEPVKDGE